MRFDGKKVLVTGAASGIGRAVAQRFAREGASVVAADVNLPEAEAALRDLPGAHRCVAFDAGDPDSCRAAVATAAENGGLDVVCNIAGILDWGPTLDFDEARFARVVAVDLLGVYAVTRAALPFLIPVKGAIVNMASTAAFDGQIGQAAYSASKSGVAGMTLPIARVLSVVGIRVNTVAPGLIDTPIYGEGEGSEAFKAKLTKDVLFPDRLGYASELASMVMQLITNSYMNAQTIRVDGGARFSPK